MALSFVGTWMQNFTLPAYIDDRTESAALVGLLVFMQLGPLLLLSLVGGVLADRFNRMRFLITMQVVQMVVTDRAGRARRHAQPAVGAVRRGRC